MEKEIGKKGKKRKINYVTSVWLLPSKGVRVFFKKNYNKFNEGEIHVLPSEEASSLIRRGIADFPYNPKKVILRIIQDTDKYRKGDIVEVSKKEAKGLLGFSSNNAKAELVESENVKSSYLSQELDNIIPEHDSILKWAVNYYSKYHDIPSKLREIEPSYYDHLIKAMTIGSEPLRLTAKDYRNQKVLEDFLDRFKSVSFLLQVDPVAIRLPFVAIAIENFLMLYRSSYLQKNSSMKLINLSDEWLNTLPSRQGGDIPWSDDKLAEFIKAGMKEGYSRQQVILLISKKLGISPKRLEKIKLKRR